MLATRGHEHTPPTCDPSKWPEKIALIIINGEQCPGKWKNTLQDNIQGPEYEAFLKEKFQWTDTQLAAIDWEVHASLEGRKSPADRSSFCKMTHQWVSTGHILRTLGKITPCNECGQTETWEHVFRCNARDEVRRTHWRTTIKEIEKATS